jgi:hypothetical protein
MKFYIEKAEVHIVGQNYIRETSTFEIIPDTGPISSHIIDVPMGSEEEGRLVNMLGKGMVDFAAAYPDN